MADPILISICIPAYQRIDFLKRLLDSITGQTFLDFEVIVTDDSPDESVKTLCDQYKNEFHLQYYHNLAALGTPANWNEAIRHAKGEWIKLMHDDDWFADKDSLLHFAHAITANPSSTFIFSAYRNNYADTNKTKDVFIESGRYKMLRKNPLTLLSKNSIGPPSVVIHKKQDNMYYDINLKWLVDIDFYMRYLSSTKPIYIPDVLINIGISDTQVTKYTFGNRKVEIPENFYLLEKNGDAILNNILFFDSWWRLMRNLGIKDIKDIRESGYEGNIPPKIRAMINFQNKIPGKLLKNGFISKPCMFLCFLYGITRATVKQAGNF